MGAEGLRWSWVMGQETAISDRGPAELGKDFRDVMNLKDDKFRCDI